MPQVPIRSGNNQTTSQLYELPCCMFKINSPDDVIEPESGPAVMSRTQMLHTI
jgi:hypothetical protein